MKSASKNPGYVGQTTLRFHTFVHAVNQVSRRFKKILRRLQTTKSQPQGTKTFNLTNLENTRSQRSVNTRKDSELTVPTTNATVSIQHYDTFTQDEGYFNIANRTASVIQETNADKSVSTNKSQDLRPCRTDGSWVQQQTSERKNIQPMKGFFTNADKFLKEKQSTTLSEPSNDKRPNEKAVSPRYIHQRVVRKMSRKNRKQLPTKKQPELHQFLESSRSRMEVRILVHPDAANSYRWQSSSKGS